MWWKRQPKRIYLDFAAATPIRKEVERSMRPYWRRVFANASAIHKEGQQARQAISDARRMVARLLGVRENRVVFTGSGTESNNLAIYGSLRQVTEAGRTFADCEIVTTKIQHPSVTEALKHLESHGVKVHYCPVNEEGKVDKQSFRESLNEKTVLVTLAYANSETGTIEDIRKLSRIIEEYKSQHGTEILFHVDAAQAPLWLSCRLESLGADLLSLDAGKCYGPKGIGLLAFQSRVAIKGIMLGGGQEFGLRAGTENVAGIVGAAKALELAQSDHQKRSEKVRQLRDRLLNGLLEIEGVELNGGKEDRLPNNINISISGLDSEFVVVSLDTAGVAASTKSACGGAKSNGSYVVQEMTGDKARANSTVRLTLGEETTKREVDKVVQILGTIIQEQLSFRSSLNKK